MYDLPHVLVGAMPLLRDLPPDTEIRKQALGLGGERDNSRIVRRRVGPSAVCQQLPPVEQAHC